MAGGAGREIMYGVTTGRTSLIQQEINLEELSQKRDPVSLQGIYAIGK
jgi:hypothetical protein